ncbi:hypothetical protein SteCoe_16229 [Stentor coeruleus]|uniref:Uncharacterized protein n=1 Tax=Stentor coeruleus TaxID=5963 RepID=A0A1R2C1Y9_9CILI|nr:hypothetical protein SteCoe_16229 [Stentor coeruleus]
MSNQSIPPNEDLMRKIVVLRKALQKESEDRQKEFDELESLKKKLSILELTLSEKDTQIQIISSERLHLEAEVEKLSQTSNSSTPLQGINKSVATLEQQNKKLLDEYNLSKHQNIELKAKYDNLTQKQNEIKKQIMAKDGHLKSVLEELKINLEEATREKELIEKDLEISRSAYFTLSDSYNKLQNEYQENLEKQKNLGEEIINFTKELQAKQTQLSKLNERLLKQSENEAILSNRLMQYKNELAEAESYYQKHEVVKINSLNNTQAIIVLKHDHTGEYVIEIEERKDKMVYGIKSVENVGRHPHNERRFFIRMADNSVIEFESVNAESIVMKINFFLDKARE